MLRYAMAIFAVIAFAGSDAIGAGESRLKESRVLLALNQRAINLGANISASGKEMADNEMAQMQAGIAVSQYAPVELTCLLRLSNATERVSGELHALLISVALSETAIAPFDRASATSYSRLTADTARDVISNSRDVANSVAGGCPQSAIVNQKAQDVLLLLEDSENEIDRITNEIGHSKYSQPGR